MPAPLFHNQYDKYFSSQECSNYRKGSGSPNPQTPLGFQYCSLLPSCDVLTRLQQLSAPSGSTSGPRHCQSTPRYERWDLMFQILCSGLGRSIRVNYVRRLPAGRFPPGLRTKVIFIQTNLGGGEQIGVLTEC